MTFCGRWYRNNKVKAGKGLARPERPPKRPFSRDIWPSREFRVEDRLGARYPRLTGPLTVLSSSLLSEEVGNLAVCWGERAGEYYSLAGFLSFVNPNYLARSHLGAQ